MQSSFPESLDSVRLTGELHAHPYGPKPTVVDNLHRLELTLVTMQARTW